MGFTKAKIFAIWMLAFEAFVISIGMAHDLTIMNVGIALLILRKEKNKEMRTR